MADLKSKFKSAKQEWETPQELFDVICSDFDFDFDLAANSANAKCANYYTEADNALKQAWHGTCWLNPPYGASSDNKLSRWIQKAYDESLRNGAVIVCLIPARTNTIWFHNYCMKAKEIRFLKGRPKFVGATHGLPQPLCLVVFQNHQNAFPVIKTQDIAR